jgi:hypothetical protein
MLSRGSRRIEGKEKETQIWVNKRRIKVPRAA